MTLQRKLSGRVTEAVAWRVTEQLGRSELADRVRRLEDLVGQNGEIEKRISELERRLAVVERTADWSANELARISPQVAAFEVRLEEQARPAVFTGELEDLPEARLLVDVVREEHARVRARLALVSAYEERLRVLESRILREPAQ
jgi:hypothetical protein